MSDLAALMGWQTEQKLKPAARPRVAVAKSEMTDGLVWRPSVRSRNAVLYHTLRAWRSDAKRQAIAQIKAAKAALDPALVKIMATEIAGAVEKMFWPQGNMTIVPVAPGHSQKYEANLAAMVASAVAVKLECPVVWAFEARPVKGVSHPKEFKNLPPLQWMNRPTGPILLLDDIATSGWHLEEAATLLRQQAAPVIALAWLGGEVKAG